MIQHVYCSTVVEAYHLCVPQSGHAFLRHLVYLRNVGYLARQSYVIWSTNSCCGYQNRQTNTSISAILAYDIRRTSRIRRYWVKLLYVHQNLVECVDKPDLHTLLICHCIVVLSSLAIGLVFFHVGFYMDCYIMYM